MVKVDLKAKPFNLSEEDIKWVKDTIASMTLEEKIGQLFINMGSSRTKEYLTDVLNNYHIAGVRYNPGTAEEVYDQNKILQENSKIPLLIAANTEAGGNGACTDGTEVGVEVKIGATNDMKWAYEMGRVSGVEPAAIAFFLDANALLDEAFTDIGYALEKIQDADLQDRESRFALFDHISYKLLRANFLFSIASDLTGDLHVNIDHLYTFIEKIIMTASTEEQLKLLNDIYKTFEEMNDIYPINIEDNTLNKEWIEKLTSIEALIMNEK